MRAKEMSGWRRKGEEGERMEACELDAERGGVRGLQR